MGQDHWERIYRTNDPKQVSWYQPEPQLSLDLIRRVVSDYEAPIIDVGGGASALVDGLLNAGYRNVTVLDLVPSALAIARRRLGSRAGRVEWLAGSVFDVRLHPSAYAVWHDRAVFHFLTDPADRARYVDQARRAVRPNGHVIVASFGPDGPTRCSGLDVVRYSPEARLGMTDVAGAQAPLEAVLKDEILRMYQEVADQPEGTFHFYHGREAATLFGYSTEWLDRAPAGAVASFAGVGNPHARSHLKAGETVLDLGSGAGLDAVIAAWQVGPAGRVIGVDLNPAMCVKAQAHVATTGMQMECREGGMENIPVPDGTVDVVISNGVINLSFRKRRVVEEVFRVLRPGGRISITDIVSAKQLSQSIVNDPKLWAS